MVKKSMQVIFIVVILFILLAGLLRTVFFPKDINYYENRYANKLTTFSLSSYWDNSFQDSAESALNDQVQFAQYFKKLYHMIYTKYTDLTLSPILAQNPDRYVDYMDLQLFGEDYLTYSPYVLSNCQAALDLKIANYNACFQSPPETSFYIYYIEKDTDINFETGEKVGLYEYLQTHLPLSPDHISRFEVDSFETYRRFFYHSDHHWNHLGSYQGYTELLALLGVTDTPLPPIEEITLSQRLSGSKASSAGAEGFSEPFTAYRFDFPSMNIQINGIPVEDYGNQTSFLSGSTSPVSYGAFYGDDSGEVIFDTNQPNRENLLILGESFDNAVLKLLATHYNHTYAVDLRNYNVSLGREFSLSAYLEEHQINRVLLMGNIDYFLLDTFLLED